MLLDFHQNGTLSHAFTRCCGEASDHTGLVGLDRVFHLHGLKDNHGFAFGDFLSLFDVDLDDGALHGGCDSITRNSLLAAACAAFLGLLLGCATIAAC